MLSFSYFVLSSAFFVMSVLGPDVPLIGAGLNLRIEDFILVLMGLVALPLMTLHKPLHFRGHHVFWGLVLLFLLCLVSGTYNVLLGNHFELMPFVKEVIRYVKYSAVFLLFLLVRKENWPGILKVLILTSLITVLIQGMQYWDFLGVNDFLKKMYRYEIFYEGSESVNKETGGWTGGSTFANKNVYGNFLLIPFGFCIGSFFVAAGKPSLKPARKLLYSNALASIIFLCAIVMTQSRTALISAVILCVTLVYLLKKRSFFASKFLIKNLMLVSVGALSAALLIHFAGLGHIINLRGGFSYELTGGRGSAAFKMEEFTKQVILNPGVNPFFGASPGAKHFVADFEYGYFFYWYGLIGLLGYCAFIWFIFRFLFAHRESVRAMVLSGIFVSFVIFGFGATSFLNNRVFPIFLSSASNGDDSNSTFSCFS